MGDCVSKPKAIEPKPSGQLLKAVTTIPETLTYAVVESQSSNNQVWQFTFEELAKATGYFSNKNFLGEGGFGQVYKGVVPPNDAVFAIKRLKYQSDKQLESEFMAEIKALTTIGHHPNLVKLAGYCSDGANRLLVYELVTNNSLNSHLHEQNKPTMDWSKRMKIAIGSAKGLEYLHDVCKPKIIHRDIKAANILLDSNFEPKVADFGLAKFFPESGSVTHISSSWKGTKAYADPEDYPNQKVSEKSDVYSFGVVLLELISGRRPSVGDVDIVKWAEEPLLEALDSNNYANLIDPRLKQYEPTEMKRMTACAAACVRRDRLRRPQMKKIVEVLDGTINPGQI